MNWKTATASLMIFLFGMLTTQLLHLYAGDMGPENNNKSTFNDNHAPNDPLGFQVSRNYVPVKQNSSNRKSVTSQPERPPQQLAINTSGDHPSTADHQILVNQLQDAHYVSTHSYAEIAAQIAALPDTDQREVLREMQSLIQLGRLQFSDFKRPNPPRYKSIAEGAAIPSSQERIHYESIQTKLRQQGFEKKQLFQHLTSETKTLPPPLKQDLADQVNNMIKSGELDTSSMPPNIRELIHHKESKLFIH